MPAKVHSGQEVLLIVPSVAMISRQYEEYKEIIKMLRERQVFEALEVEEPGGCPAFYMQKLYVIGRSDERII